MKNKKIICVNNNIKIAYECNKKIVKNGVTLNIKNVVNHFKLLNEKYSSDDLEYAEKRSSEKALNLLNSQYKSFSNEKYKTLKKIIYNNFKLYEYHYFFYDEYISGNCSFYTYYIVYDFNNLNIIKIYTPTKIEYYFIVDYEYLD